MKNKGKIILSVVGVVLSVALLVASTILSENEIINTAGASVILSVSVLLVLISVFYAAKVDYKTGVYECRKCGHTFKPAFKAYLWGAHTLTARRLKCPKCKEKSWCIRKTAN